MEEKRKSGNKPLRPSFNRTMDLAKTYFKNEGKKKMQKKEQEIEDNEIPVEVEATAEQENSENTFSESEVSEMLTKIENLTKERDNAKEIMLRNAAELENFRRRTMKEKEDLVMYANERLLSKFTEILDTLDQAIESGKQSDDHNSILHGLTLLRDKTNKLFEEAGVKQMENPVGKEFDLNEMDAILAMPSEDIPEGHVVQLVSNGYVFHERVLKHAKVITSSGKP